MDTKSLDLSCSNYSQKTDELNPVSRLHARSASSSSPITQHMSSKEVTDYITDQLIALIRKQFNEGKQQFAKEK